MESDYEGNELSFAQIIAAASICEPSRIQIKHGSGTYQAVIRIALLYYDYFLTFTREVEWFWFAHNRFSWASLFFFANRYVSVLGHFPYIYEFFSFRNDPGRLKACIGLRSFREIICFVTQIFVGFFLITRTYALWNRSKYVLWFLMGISIPVIAYTIVSPHVNPLKATYTLTPQQGHLRHDPTRISWLHLWRPSSL
ncbi:hypothetical protein FA13DRAFT_1730154 [Coprinellus micaceus]|uniref:DUF6533 domain-containing protein n=1 Tax=Coprinellus micaceus TaxID=71717 RepID=A0A4Y7TIS7_COPMI|nr:hypothetical protein FA13DRAFT_1730154 [Coprinellus micaceus]